MAIQKWKQESDILGHNDGHWPSVRLEYYTIKLKSIQLHYMESRVSILNSIRSHESFYGAESPGPACMFLSLFCFIQGCEGLPWVESTFP